MDLDIVYTNKIIEEQCNSIKAAKKKFGGDEGVAYSFLSRIYALKMADSLHDIIIQHQFHFHGLHNKNGRNYNGLFSIDVKSRTSPWRIIIEPLDSDSNPYKKCHIDEISKEVRTIRIVEVSKHYE